MDQYQLSAELFGHQADVRSVAPFSGNQFASSSKDCTIRIWQPKGGNVYECVKILEGHQQTIDKGGVGTLLWIPAGMHPNFTAGALCSGGYDRQICVWDGEGGLAPALSLIGHNGAVTCLALTQQGYLLSGSADNSIRLWDGNTCIQILEGHKFPVWGVLQLANGDIVSCSGDATIRIWRDGQCIKTISAHAEAVRGLANVAGMGFLSCSNDGLIKLWSFDGELQATLGAHNNFVYSVAVSPFGEFVSAGEDGAVCVWRDNERIQTLRHPTGIWSVTVLDSGDIITAGQDSVVRVWTRDAARAAPPEYIAEYESRMSSKVGDLNLNELPTESSLASNPGIKDGETRIVRGTAGNALLYFWKSVDRKWELQGEVQNAINNAGGKTRIGNKEYDQVFDVDLGEGEGGMRKLGVNIGQNEYEAAQEFINREELNQDFLEQIADFIRKNVAPVQLGTQQQDYSVDPFSSNRYRPGGANTAGGSTGAAPLIDPFTPNRYRPGDMNTGITTSTATSTTTSGSYIPQRYPVYFETGNIEAIGGKILQLNQGLQGTTGVSGAELTALEQLIKTIKETSRYHASTITPQQVSVLRKLVTSWPEAMRFPLLDLLRLGVFHSDFAPKVADFVNGLDGELDSSAPTTNQTMALRFLSNCFKYDILRKAVLANSANLLSRCAVLDTSTVKSVRVGVATLALNLSIFTNQLAQDAKSSLARLILHLVEAEDDDEILARAVTALGTFAIVDPSVKHLVTTNAAIALVQQRTQRPMSDAAFLSRQVLKVLQ